MKTIINKQDANPAIKIATAFLLLFLLAGIISSVAHGIRNVGFAPGDITAHYLGDEERMTYPMELPELMESTHVHLFMIPLVYYTLCHLFAQTAISIRWKAVVIVLSFINIAGFLITPYLIRYISFQFAVLVPVNDLIFILSAGILTISPLREVFKN